MTLPDKSQPISQPAAAEGDESVKPFFVPPEMDDLITDMPPHFTIIRATELFGWRPGESLSEAIARQEAQEKSGCDEP